MPPSLAIGNDVALQWVQREGASTCIGDRELAAAVTARLGNAPARGRTRLVIDGEIAPAATGWTASIRTFDDDAAAERGAVLGQRDLREPAADCRAFDDKLVLVIALIIDPELLDEPAKPAPTPAPVAIPILERMPWHVTPSIAALASHGMLPGFAFGTAVAAMIEPPRVWPIELSASLWPYDRANAAPGGATFLQLTGGVALCPHLGGPLGLCVGAQAGEVRARGFGYDRDQLVHELVIDATLELRLDWQLASSFGMRAGAGAWVPFERPQYNVHELAGDAVIFQPSPAAFEGEIALWARF